MVRRWVDGLSLLTREEFCMREVLRILLYWNPGSAITDMDMRNLEDQSTLHYCSTRVFRQSNHFLLKASKERYVLMERLCLDIRNIWIHSHSQLWKARRSSCVKDTGLRLRGRGLCRATFHQLNYFILQHLRISFKGKETILQQNRTSCIHKICHPENFCIQLNKLCRAECIDCMSKVGEMQSFFFFKCQTVFHSSTLRFQSLFFLYILC